MRQAVRRRAVRESMRAAAALEERWPRIRDALAEMGTGTTRAGCVETAATRAFRSQVSRAASARDALRLAEALGLAYADGSAQQPQQPPGVPPLPEDALFSNTMRSEEGIPASLRDLCLVAAADQEA